MGGGVCVGDGESSYRQRAPLSALDRTLPEIAEGLSIPVALTTWTKNGSARDLRLLKGSQRAEKTRMLLEKLREFPNATEASEIPESADFGCLLNVFRGSPIFLNVSKEIVALPKYRLMFDSCPDVSDSS